MAALLALLRLNLAIFRQKIVLNPKLQASRCEILRLDVSLRTLQTPRCECEDGFSHAGPPPLGGGIPKILCQGAKERSPAPVDANTSIQA